MIGLVCKFLGCSGVVTNKDVVDYDSQWDSMLEEKNGQRISSVMVQSSIPIPAIFVKSDGVESSKNAGLGVCWGAQKPLYAGFGILGTVHLPCNPHE